MSARLDAVYVTFTLVWTTRALTQRPAEDVRIGDVPRNGVRVLSASFMDILDILTSNREAPQRVLQFKDVFVASASWPQGEGSKERRREEDEGGKGGRDTDQLRVG